MIQDSTVGMQIATAGQFLKKYESKRYTLFERYSILGIFGQHQITVPLDPETFADVSFWQAGMNWTEYKTHARAAILRIGQGSWVDTEFNVNYQKARENSVILGGYWFYDGRNSPAEQAAKIVEAMKGKYFEMELYVDYERDYGGKYDGLKNVVALMKLLEGAGLKVKDIGLYSGYYWMTDHRDATFDEYLKNKPLWLAWYASPAVVKVPAPWTSWVLWQSGTPAVKWGQPTAELDYDVFNGSKAEFTIRYGLGVQMVKVTVLANPSMNIRETQDFASADKGDLMLGDIVYGEQSGNWVHIQQIWRKTGQFELNPYYVYVGNSAWTKVEAVSAIPNPPSTGATSYEVILNERDVNGNIVNTYRGIVTK